MAKLREDGALFLSQEQDHLQPHNSEVADPYKLNDHDGGDFSQIDNFKQEGAYDLNGIDDEQS